ncbi:hypothetical protein [Coxiella-like endosymbiont of Rhipicephalus sanguineus]|nr:hypothetical protein [Coxiella-like endosymbiont of Rhipicephalus sanguineus]
MTPDQHDELVAKSQSITYLIGCCLKVIDLRSTEIDIVGYLNLLAVMEQN